MVTLAQSILQWFARTSLELKKFIVNLSQTPTLARLELLSESTSHPWPTGLLSSSVWSICPSIFHSHYFDGKDMHHKFNQVAQNTKKLKQKTKQKNLCSKRSNCWGFFFLEVQICRIHLSINFLYLLFPIFFGVTGLSFPNRVYFFIITLASLRDPQQVRWETHTLNTLLRVSLMWFLWSSCFSISCILYHSDIVLDFYFENFLSTSNIILLLQPLILICDAIFRVYFYWRNNFVLSFMLVGYWALNWSYIHYMRTLSYWWLWLHTVAQS